MPDAANPSASMSRAYYAATIPAFFAHSDADIIAALTKSSEFAIEPTQRDAWLEEIAVMRSALEPFRSSGFIAFEFAVPRVGRRIDVLALIGPIIFVLEFKVGDSLFAAHATDQVWDYALDLKNFHSTSHTQSIVPILVATRAQSSSTSPAISFDHDGVAKPVHASPDRLKEVLQSALRSCPGPNLDAAEWATGRYSPTPTIIEAAMALYGQHSVEEISRSDASAINLSQTADAIDRIISDARNGQQKSICFITGVPGAGKTLVGLKTATAHYDKASELHSVFLSGNGPLVSVLREALARDKVSRERARGNAVKLGASRSEVKAFIQNVHHFRDECLRDPGRPPIERVTLFDEAQRAWNKDQTAAFMHRKKGLPDFAMSEPEFLISCMDRHRDWAVIVCLVGGGQEINTGEAGIGEWVQAIRRSFGSWHVYLSPHLHDSEYAAGKALELLRDHAHVHTDRHLHLSVSMRSFRAEHVSALVKAILDLDLDQAKSHWASIRDRYPIVLTRNVAAAKAWLKGNARGTERYGMVVSSQAYRLKPHAIDVRTAVDPVHWFLHPKEDVRSSFYLEDVATEFQVQGLELDWSCLVWDGDFRHAPSGWDHWSFRGDKWQRIRAAERKAYLKNAYRVLLTRARQGMAIVVPSGDPEDPTRHSSFYDSTFDYLQAVGFPVVH